MLNPYLSFGQKKLSLPLSQQVFKCACGIKLLEFVYRQLVI
jgi:hypothetical protein